MARGPIAVGAFYTGHIGADLPWYTIVSAGVAKGRRFLPPRGWRWLADLCGVGLVALGLVFVTDGWRGWLAVGFGRRS